MIDKQIKQEWICLARAIVKDAVKTGDVSFFQSSWCDIILEIGCLNYYKESYIREINTRKIKRGSK